MKGYKPIVEGIKQSIKCPEELPVDVFWNMYPISNHFSFILGFKCKKCGQAVTTEEECPFCKTKLIYPSCAICGSLVNGWFKDEHIKTYGYEQLDLSQHRFVKWNNGLIAKCFYYTDKILSRIFLVG